MWIKGVSIKGDEDEAKNVGVDCKEELLDCEKRKGKEEDEDNKFTGLGYQLLLIGARRLDLISFDEMGLLLNSMVE